MYDLPELNRRWERYRMRVVIRRAVYAAVLFLAVLVGLLWSFKDSLTSKSPVQKSLVQESKVAQAVPLPPIKAPQPARLQPSVANSGGLTLRLFDEPEQDTVAPVQNIQKQIVTAPLVVQPPKQTAVAQKQPEATPPPKQPQPQQVVAPVVLSTPIAAPPPPVVAQKPPGGVIIESSQTDMVVLLETRFKQQSDFATALSLSREYYKRAKFDKALKWAVTANGIDSRVDESWIIFARCSVKLGRKADAINALENFNKHYATNESKTVLSQIKNGE